MKIIREYKIFDYIILTIKHDYIHDQYWLFNKYKIFQIENNRDFWNDWE